MADATALAATMFDVRTSRPLDRSWSVSPFDGRRDAAILLFVVACLFVVAVCCLLLLLFAVALIITLR
jgi:hypothetical protein